MRKTPNSHDLLAIAILQAAKLHDDSWDRITCQHKITISNAAALVTSNKDRQQLVYMLLAACWNDAISWALQIRGARADA